MTTVEPKYESSESGKDAGQEADGEVEGSMSCRPDRFVRNESGLSAIINSKGQVSAGCY